MNKEITIYELLGLIKEGKEPKKIKYNYVVYEYKEIPEGTGYVNEFDNCKIWLANKIDIDDKEKLNKKVEIIEEDKDIEEIEQIMTSKGTYTNFDVVYKDMTKVYETVDEIIIKLNKIIKEVNKLRKENE